MSRTLLRAGTLLGTTAVLALAVASPAFAHVTANPDTAVKGGYGVVTFRVPDEDDSAGTIALTVSMPADHPFASVRTTPVAGWTATTNEITLNPPLKDDDGNQITKTIGSVTWKANPGNKIAPGQYLDFPLSLGPFPDDADVLRMPAVQTYDNGQVVNWSDPPNADGSEPEHPAPSVTLSGAAADDAAHGGMSATAAPAAPPSDDNTARWLGGAGLLLGALGLGFGGGALLRSRRAGKSS
ncbi:MAG TPA: YcnI family protein [Pseudonocardia sp.]